MRSPRNPVRFSTDQRGDTHEHVGDVPPVRHQVAVRCVGRNVEDVAGAHRIPRPTRDACAAILAVAPGPVNQVAAHEHGPGATLYEHDVLYVLMLLGDTVRVPMNEPEAVSAAGVAVVGEGLAGGVVRTHPRRQARVPLFQV